MTQPFSRLTFGIILTLLSSLVDYGTTNAQIIPDNSLGAESSQTRPDTIKNTPSDVIDGGATRGSNLFHSFREFNIQEGRGAYFANPDVIQNIFSRVTGGNISQILGTLGVLGNANLFLINPSGIIFGPNARLDMRGAFIGATADSVVFDNNFEFSATNPNAPPLLTVNIPLGLRFRESPADINSTAFLTTPSHLTLKAGNLNIGGTLFSGGDLTLEALNTLTIRDSVESPFIAVSGGNLLLQGNQSIDIYALNHSQSGIIAGGDLVLRSANAVSGDAHYWSGGSFRIEKLDGTLGGLVSLYDPIIRASGDVELDFYRGTSLHILAGGYVYIPGMILITGVDETGDTIAETITLSDGSTINIDGSVEPTLDIRAGTTAVGSPFDDTGTPTSADIVLGNIYTDFVDGTGGQIFLTNQYQPNTALSSPNGIRVREIDTSDKYGGGYLVIDARSGIKLTGQINVSARNVLDSDLPSYLGNGGDVRLLSQGNISSNSSIFAQGLLSGNVSLISTGDVFLDDGLEINVRGGGGGNITINAQNLSLLNASKLQAGIASGLGTPEAQAGDITINATESVAIADGSLISNALLNTGIGNAGDIEITTNSLVLTDGGQISTRTFGIGNAGAVKITVSDLIYLSGVDSNGYGSSIRSRVESNAQGNAEGIEIITDSLYLNDGAQLDASTFGIGNAEAVKITASETIYAVGEDSQGFVSGIYSTVDSTARGNAGGIEILTGSLSLADGAVVNASTYGQGNAGTIKITASDTTSAVGENRQGNVSGIYSTVAKSTAIGNSGDIEIYTGSLSLTDGAVVSANTYGKGNAGAIKITATNTIFLSGKDNQGFGNYINSEVKSKAEGNAGKIEIITGSLSLNDGANVSASSLGKGNAGSIKITASDTISATGEDTKGNISGIFIQVAETAEGNSGDIEISTGSLFLSNGAQVNTNTFGKVDAGAIKIIAGDTISAVGESNLGFSSGIYSAVANTAEGSSRGIEISTGSLFLTDGAVVDARTLGIGDAGVIKITASDIISLSGEDNQGSGGYISSRVDSKAIGNSGGIEISTGSLFLNNGANVSASTLGKGNAGVIKITASDTISLSGEDRQDQSSAIFGQVVDTGSGNAGGIEIATGSLFLTDGAVVDASTFSQGSAGGIKITATDTISLSGEDRQGSGSFISSTVDETVEGNSGGIEIITGSLFLSNGAAVSASTLGKGNAGAIKITARDTISLSGENSQDQISRIGSVVGETAEGNSGSIEIITDSLSLNDGSLVSASTLGKGNAGAVKITARDTISLSGEDRQGSGSGIFSTVAEETKANSGGIEISTGSLFLVDGAVINASTFGRGNAGAVKITARETISLSGEDSQRLSSSIGSQVTGTAEGNSGGIEISTGSLSLTDGAAVNASTFGRGNAGAVKITARETISIAGENSEGDASGIFSTVESTGEGNSGGIEIITGSLSLTDGAIVSASTFGKGNAGAIKITARETISIAGEDSKSNVSGIFSAVVDTAEGSSGGIEISTGSLSLTDGAVVSTSTGGKGNAGAIRITASETISLNGLDNNGLGSYIRSRVESEAEGNAGGIEIITSLLSLSDGAQVDASTVDKGNAGTIKITASDTISIAGEDSESNVSGIFSTVEQTGQGNSEGIEITTGSLSLTDGAAVNASTYNMGNAGAVKITARDTIFAVGENRQGFVSGIFSTVAETGQGNSGGIEIITGFLSLVDGAAVNVSTSGKGSAGAVKITADDTISAVGEDRQGYNSGIFSIVFDTAEGNSGGIEIITDSLSLGDGAAVNASTFGKGNAGAVKITARDTITAIGEDSQGDVSGIFSAVAFTAEGNSGGIEIITGSLFLNDGAAVDASTLGRGNAGAVKITASSTISLTGEDNQGDVSSIASAVDSTAIGNSAGIEITTSSLSLNDKARVSAETLGQGTAGNITITANTLESTNTSQIQTNTQNNFEAGDITLNISDTLNLSNSSLIAKTTGEGKAGNITINASKLNLVEGATISAGTSAQGDGGSITVNSPTLVTLGENSQLNVETSGAGKAGNIEITSDTVTIGKDAQISATATATASNTSGGGSININASNLNIAGKLGIFAETQGIAPAGALTLNPDSSNPNLNIRFIEQGLISASTSASGNGGDINISAQNHIDISGNGTIATSTSGSGNAGTINLNTNQLNLSSGVTVTASTTKGTGNAGNINLNARQINLEQATVNAFTNGGGNAGSILVPNAQTIALDNSRISTEIQAQGTTTEPSNINLQTQQLILDNNSQITATTSGNGDAGTITATADSLRLTNRSSIQTNTSSSGIAGDLVFNLSNDLTLDNSTLEASTSPNSTGNGGSIKIDPRTVTLNNNARISVNSQGTGDGGNLSLVSENLFLNERSSISATTASGEGGNITLNVKDTVTQRNNSPISATAGGTGNGGNITLNTRFLVGNENSNITANAFQGRGGNINITADGIFRGSNSPITASSQLGVDGVVDTNTPEVDPSRGLLNLPQNPVDPNTLIAQNACRRGGQSEFTVTGGGGLPNTPEQVQRSNEVEVGLVDATQQTATSKPKKETLATRKIIPAQGWQRNDKGEMVLVATPTNDNAHRQTTMTDTCSLNQ